MARTLYGFTGGDILAKVDADGDYAPSTATYEAYTTRTGSTQLTDLQTYAGAATTTIVGNSDENGRILFYGPDPYTAGIWLKDTANPSKARWLVNPVDLADRATGAIDESGLLHKATNETVTGVKTFTTNPVFNDDAIPTAKVSGLDEALSVASVSTQSMTTALTEDGHTLQAQFLAAAGADNEATRDLFATILGLVRTPAVGKSIFNRDFTAATATTVTRPYGTDTIKTIVRWRATDGTTTVPTAFIAGNDEIRIVRQTA